MPAARDHVKTIFGQAAEIASPEDRSHFLDEACSGDHALRAEVEDLLASMSQAGDFLVPCHFTDQTLDSQRPERPGTIIGPYKLLQQIGEGGFGVVYMAEQQEPVQRRVALKIIKPGMDTRQVIARFEAERQALALMDHPNIARVLDAGATGEVRDDHTSAPNPQSVIRNPQLPSGRPFFVMELVKGTPMTKYCDEKHFNLRQRLELMIPVCQAIQHAHQKGIIHRDIKPSNVLIAQYDGRPVPKVIDFGVAKATAQRLTERTMFTELGQVVGTIEYMSPEQAELNQLDIDTRSDIYSLGVLLYELLTGSTPFDKKRLRAFAFHEMLRIIREEDPPKPSTKLSTIDTLPSIAANRQIEPVRLTQSLRGELDWIVMKALEKDRNRRYESASGLARDLERYLTDEPVQACPPSTLYRFRKTVRKHRAAFNTAALLAAALLLGMGISTWQAVRATKAEKLANQRLNIVEFERQQAELHANLAREAAAKAKKAESAAKKSAAESDAVFRFFEDKVLAAGRPEGDHGGLGKDVTLRQAVDAAEPAVAAAFKDQPLVEARLRQVFAQTYQDLGEPELLLKQAVRGLKLRKAYLPRDSESVLWAMGTVGHGYLATGNPEQALPLFDEAFTLAKSKFGSESPTTLFCMGGLAVACHRAGKIDQAVQLSEELLRIRQKLHPEGHATLTAMNDLAVAYANAGKQQQAIKLFEEVLAVLQAKLGPKHPDTLDVLQSLAVRYLAEDKVDEALQIFEELVKVRTDLQGQQHPATLRAMAHLGSTYLRAGKIDLALPLLEQTLRWSRAKLGPDHAETIWTMGILVAALETTRPDEALRLSKEAFDLSKAKFGTDHPRTLSSMNSLAHALNDAGRSDEALPLMEEAHQFWKAKRPEHPNTLISMGNLALIYGALGEFDQAVLLSQEVLKLQQATLGADHGSTLKTMDNLGAMYRNTGKAKEAVEIAEVALRGQRAKLGPEHPETLTTLSNLALSYEMAGNPDLALSTMQDALKLRTEVLGNENHLTLRTQSNLARMYDTRGEFARADALFRESHPRLQSTHGPEHPWTLETAAMFGLNLLHQAKYGEAEPLLRQCVATNEKIRPDRWETFHAKSLLGGCLLGLSRATKNSDATAAQEKLTEAESLLLTGYKGLKARAAKILASEKMHSTEALERLVELYSTWEKPEEEAKWKKELDAAAMQSRSASP